MATYTIAAGEAKRKDYAVYFITDDTKAAALSFVKADLQIIGKGIDDMPMELSATTEESDDVLGNHTYAVTAISKTTTVDPIKIDGNDKFATFIDDAIERDATLDELEKYFLCVKAYKTTTVDSATELRAWVQKAVVEPTAEANGLNGIADAVALHWVGEKIFGHVNPATMAFTED